LSNQSTLDISLSLFNNSNNEISGMNILLDVFANILNCKLCDGSNFGTQVFLSLPIQEGQCDISSSTIEEPLDCEDTLVYSSNTLTIPVNKNHVGIFTLINPPTTISAINYLGSITRPYILKLLPASLSGTNHSLTINFTSESSSSAGDIVISGSTSSSIISSNNNISDFIVLQRDAVTQSTIVRELKKFN
jgi:hypothetical protein